jgi:hypothetical protein
VGGATFARSPPKHQARRQMRGFTPPAALLDLLPPTAAVARVYSFPGATQSKRRGRMA